MYHGVAVSAIPRLSVSLSTWTASRALVPAARPRHVARCGRRAMSSSSTAASDEPGRQDGVVTKRAVAGSFLFKLPDGDEKQAKVALFRRSAAVRTYQHKLAPLSGSVETEDASPLATALREIREETTLAPPSIELLRIGKPYSFTDGSISREWTINPFAFRLKGPAEGGSGEEGIVLDWEHDGIEWFDPLEVADTDEFGGVPKLVHSLRRVWPEYDLGPQAGRVLTDGLQRLRDDHESGARQLAAVGLTVLRDVIRGLGHARPLDDRWWATVRMAAWHVCTARPSMGAAITCAVVKALDQVEAAWQSDLAPAEKVRQATEAIDRQLDDRNTATERIRDSLVDYLRRNVRDNNSAKTVSVLTLSCSSTISTCLPQAAASLGIALDLRILESRPLCEGVTLASHMLGAGREEADLKVTLYSDASAAVAARDVDVVVLGADRLSAAGDVSNKIGSLPAVLSARHVAPNAKIVVLSETEKVAGPGSAHGHAPEDNDASEVTRAWRGTAKGVKAVEEALQEGRSGVVVKNTYFEWVPAGFIDAFATEEGVWTAEDITKQSHWIGNEMDRFFNGL
ncbi:translation initiation factor eIF-2B subunit family protein [Xylariaceae sp. FL0804]|nr:translation initiation factor eIF-2B subunit family protein [Xylariaceae sp. FL0804]